MSITGQTIRNAWRPGLVIVALGFLYFAVLQKLAVHWWSDENYSHGLLVPFVIGYIVWLNFDRIRDAVEKPQLWIGGGMVAGSLFMLLGGTLGAEFFVQRISFVLMTAGILIYFFGARLMRALAIPYTLLFLAIPIPQIIFNKVAFPLQIYASQIAVWGIRMMEVPTVRKGNVIDILPQGATQVISLEVVEACSGIRSLMTLMTLALILAYFTSSRPSWTENNAGRFSFFSRVDFWRGALLVFSAVPIAILTNAGRVTATGVMTFYYGRKATSGFIHDFAGWAVYIAALGLLIAFNFLLIKIQRKVGNEAATF